MGIVKGREGRGGGEEGRWRGGEGEGFTHPAQDRGRARCKGLAQRYGEMILNQP